MIASRRIAPLPLAAASLSFYPAAPSGRSTSQPTDRRSCRLQGNRQLETRAAERRHLERHLVEDLSGSSARCARRSDQCFEPDAESCPGAICRSARRRKNLPRGYFPHGHRRDLCHALFGSAQRPACLFKNQGYQDYVIPVDVSYEPDVWGRVRAPSKPAAPKRRPPPPISPTSSLSIRAELAFDYFSLRGLDAQEAASRFHRASLRKGARADSPRRYQRRPRLGRGRRPSADAARDHPRASH